MQITEKINYKYTAMLQCSCLFRKYKWTKIMHTEWIINICTLVHSWESFLQTMKDFIYLMTAWVLFPSNHEGLCISHDRVLFPADHEGFYISHDGALYSADNEELYACHDWILFLQTMTDVIYLMTEFFFCDHDGLHISHGILLFPADHDGLYIYLMR